MTHPTEAQALGICPSSADLAAIALPFHVKPQAQPYVTLFTTLEQADAVCAGLDRKEWELGEYGGFEVHFDGRTSFPKVTVNGPDGQVDVVGFEAIRELWLAVGKAMRIAARMEGKTAP